MDNNFLNLKKTKQMIQDHLDLIVSDSNKLKLVDINDDIDQVEKIVFCDMEYVYKSYKNYIGRKILDF